VKRSTDTAEAVAASATWQTIADGDGETNFALDLRHDYAVAALRLAGEIPAVSTSLASPAITAPSGTAAVDAALARIAQSVRGLDIDWDVTGGALRMTVRNADIDLALTALSVAVDGCIRELAVLARDERIAAAYLTAVTKDFARPSDARELDDEDFARIGTGAETANGPSASPAA